MRLIFMGTPEFAVPALVEILRRGHEIAAVYTAAGKPAGRGMEKKPSAVEREARRFGLPVLIPRTLRTPDAAEGFRAHGAEAAVVVAYGLILPKSILEAVPLGCFNLHASLLPRWRGAAPIQRAIMAGDTKTGITIMRMDEGLDTGPIVRTKQVPIRRRMTASELHDVLASLGADRMVRVLNTLERGNLKTRPQPATGVTLAPKIDNRETRIDWARSWEAVRDHCHGLSRVPGAWFELAQAGEPLRIKVLRVTRGTRGKGRGPPGTLLSDRFDVACADGAVRILELQRAGRLPMRAEAFLHGIKIAPGAKLA